MNKYSFFLFVAHAPVLFATWLLFKRFGQGLPYPVYWVLAPLLTTAVVVAIYRCAMRLVPGLLSVMLGGRGKPQARPEAAQRKPSRQAQAADLQPTPASAPRAR
jgi:succinoglycan biosynthesis protein ExoH